jgi:hypothetical protein
MQGICLMTLVRVLAFGLVLAALAGCQKNDLQDPPAPLGNFVLGHNIVVTDKMQKVPISRPATGAEWEAAVEKAMADRFGRYQGTKIYDFGISIDAFALAPPGIPVVASPKSVLVISANVWDDAAKLKLNAEAERIYVFESLSPQTALGSGLTQSRQRQIDQLAYNAAKKVEVWLLQHPEWLELPAGGAVAPAVAPVAAPVAVAAPPVVAPPVVVPRKKPGPNLP